MLRPARISPRPRLRYTSRPSSRSAPGFSTRVVKRPSASSTPLRSAREGALERARVVGNAVAQLGDDLVGEGWQLGSQHLGHLGRQALPWMLGDHLWETYKKRRSR